MAKLTGEERHGLEQVRKHDPAIAADVVARLFLLGLVRIEGGRLFLTRRGVEAVGKPATEAEEGVKRARS
jgi:hypothetical protein